MHISQHSSTYPGAAIEIRAVRADGKLTLSVYNDGPGLPADWEANGAAIRLSNVRNRLHGSMETMPR